ncbi:MAG: putrescine-ornithine antiporter [Candidatus Aphodousia sp.]|nr:putrescine-ornithine antiporter [Sutterella sp.]MDY2899507.1 putrescine-ornithine antiporter [Candidatus Aphodousia sp.]
MSHNRSKMSVFELTLLTAINMMGSGIVMLPTKLAEVGTISILSWLVTAVGSLSLAYAFAKCGMFSKRPGMGGYSEYAFGKSGNFMANYTYGVSLLFANIAIAITCVGYGASFLEVELSPIQVCITTIVVIWVCTVSNFLGASITGKLSSFAVWCVIIPVIVLSVIGWFWFDPDLYVASWNPHEQPFFTAVGASISMTLWAFLGLESACANSDAIDNPEKNVPIAVMAATIGVAIIYIVSTNIIAGIVPNEQLVASNAPFGLVFAHMFSPAIGKVVMGLLVLSCAGSTLGWQFTIAKVFQQSAVDGLFPKIFARVNKYGAPIAGMIIITTIQTGFCLMTISPALFKQFNMLVDLAVVTNIMPYILSMAAVGVIMKQAKVDPGKAKFYNFVALVGAAYSFYALISTGYFEVFWGSIATFLGWTFWGIVANRTQQEETRSVA